MKTFLQIVALLVTSAATRASEYQCQYQNTTLACLDPRISQPPSGNWPDVSTLTLSKTSIAVLYKNSLSSFPYVHVLLFEDTPLAEVDLEVLADMPYLDTVNLRNNSIKNIVPAPSGVKLDNLQYVVLNNNSITSLDPNSFAAAPNLRYLYLNNNPIVVPAGQAVLKHSKLTTLHMEYVSTLDLGSESFKDVPLLGEAVLKSAGITSIAGAFATNTELEVVSLLYNSITAVKAGTFAPSGSLKDLQLIGNPLEKLEIAAVRDAMAEKGTIDISNTPLACSCDFEALYWWAQTKHITISAACGGVHGCFFRK